MDLLSVTNMSNNPEQTHPQNLSKYVHKHMVLTGYAAYGSIFWAKLLFCMHFRAYTYAHMYIRAFKVRLAMHKLAHTLVLTVAQRF